MVFDDSFHPGTDNKSKKQTNANASCCKPDTCDSELEYVSYVAIRSIQKHVVKDHGECAADQGLTFKQGVKLWSGPKVFQQSD